MKQAPTIRHLRQAEFIALMGLMTALVALSIDAVMPAFPYMATDLHATHANSIQLVIAGFYFGLSLGTFFLGPLSDVLGRKRPALIGLVIYFIGSLIIIFSHQLDILMLGRVLQGFGLAGPRACSMALIRDLYSGDQMAKVMSFIMMVFITVPIIAPCLGQAVLFIANWRALFVLFIVIALITLVWFTIRQPETLSPERRHTLSLKNSVYAFKEVINNRQAVGYTLANGMTLGAFMGYLSLAQPIFQDEYHMGNTFPLFFASLAVSIGTASYFNGRLVHRYGAKKMALWGGTILTISAFTFLMIIWGQQEQPALWLLVIVLAVILFSTGMMFGNQNALAMEHLGHVAGMGAAIVGACSSLIGVAFSVIIEQSFNNTVTPLIIGFTLLGLMTIITMQWANKKPSPVQQKETASFK